MFTVFTNRYPNAGLNDIPGQFVVPSVPGKTIVNLGP